MSIDSRSFFSSIGDWLCDSGVALHPALLAPLEPDPSDPGERTVDLDFDRWLHGDPMVTRDLVMANVTEQR
jgi:hypothetical protein